MSFSHAYSHVDVLALIGSETPLRRVASTNGGEWAGPCPGCGGRDRFRVWPHKGRYWCRVCGRKGDAIQYLRDFRGLSFAEAKRALGMDDTPPSRQQRARAALHSFALATARDAYRAWQRDKLRVLTDEYRELNAERETAETAYRLLQRRPDFFSEAEAQQWEAKLAAIYDRLAPLEWRLDILTISEYEEARFQWWQEDVEHGRISA